MKGAGKIDAVGISSRLKGSALFVVVRQRPLFEAMGRCAGGLDHSPPGDSRAVVGHHVSDRTRSS